MYIGRLDAEKHADVVIHTVAKVLQQQDIHLMVIGYGLEEQNLKQMADDLGIAEHITFGGYVPEEDKIELVKAGTVFVHASPAELQCISALEAMAAGMPFVGVNAGALPELCQDGRNGYTFELDDSSEAANHVLKILQNNSLREAFGAESIKIAHMHDMQHTLDEFEKVYKEAIKCKETVEGKNGAFWLPKALPSCGQLLKSSLISTFSRPCLAGLYCGLL